MGTRRRLLGVTLLLVLGAACRPKEEDNGGPPGVTLTAPTDALLTTRELGGTPLTFEVVLGSRPSEPVTVTLVSSAPGEAAATPSSLVFEGSGWKVPQSFTLNGVDDDLSDGDQPYTISFTVSSGDADYEGFVLPSFSATNLDDDLLQASPASPAALDFGSVAVDSVSDVLTWALQNTSPTTATSHLNDTTLTGDFALVYNSCGNPDFVTGLAPLASCEMKVRFVPRGTGSRTGTLQLTSAVGGTVSVELVGNATAVTPLTAWPHAWDFGTISVGSPTPHTFYAFNDTFTTLTNLAITPVTGDVTISAAATNPCTTTLGPRASCNFVVTFTPGAAGFASRLVTVTADPGMATTLGLSALVTP